MLRNRLLDTAGRMTPIFQRQAHRPFSGIKKSKLTTVEVDDKSGIATLSMNFPPVNTLTMELMHDMIDSINEIECNKSRGLILTSV